MGKALSDHEILIFQTVRSLLQNSSGPISVYRVAEDLAPRIPESEVDEIANSVATHVMAAGYAVLWEKVSPDPQEAARDDTEVEPVALRNARAL